LTNRTKKILAIRSDQGKPDFQGPKVIIVSKLINYFKMIHIPTSTTWCTCECVHVVL